MYEKNMIEKLKHNRMAFGLLDPEEKECFKKIGKDNCLAYVTTSDKTKWQSMQFSGFNYGTTYAIKPDYQPEPKCKNCNDTGFIVRTFTGSLGLESSWRPKDSSLCREDEVKKCPEYSSCAEVKNNIIGKIVIVYDRYHFAVPLRGRIEDVAEKDGSYKVSFFSQQHGYPNYLQMNHVYFFSQQCKIVEKETKPDPSKPEFTDLGIENKNGALLVIPIHSQTRYDSFLSGPTRIHKLPSLPNFVGFYGSSGDEIRISIEYIATQISEGEKIYARFRA